MKMSIAAGDALEVVLTKALKQPQLTSFITIVLSDSQLGY